MVRLVSRLATLRGANVELLWGVGDPRDLERAVPGLCLVEQVPFLTMPELVNRLAQGPTKWAQAHVLGTLSFYRTLVRHLRYAF